MSVKTSLRWVILVACWLSVVSIATANDNPSTHATLAIRRGEALFSAQNYSAALAEFSFAYDLLAGYPQRFAVLSNIAACHERVFQYDEAIRFYEKYLTKGGALVEDRLAIEERIHSLQRLLATVTLTSNVPADIWVDDRKVARTPTTIQLAPGKHLVELRATLHESTRKEVYLNAGSSSRLEFRLEQLSQYSGVSSAYFWTFSGLAVVAVGIGTGYGISAWQKDAAGNARSMRDRFLNTVEDERSVERAARIADVAFISAAVLGTSAAVLFFVTDWVAPHPFVVRDAHSWRVGVSGAL